MQPLARPIVVASSSCVWSAIAVIGRSPMRERRAPRTVVRRVGSRALGIFFPHTIGSSTRIGVCPVVIGVPTVCLAEIVGAGCVALAAAAAITMRLRGRAAASARPPPAVRAQHIRGLKPAENPSGQWGRPSLPSAPGCGRGAPTQAESVFERTDGTVRFKLGPSTPTAGIPEPSLSVMSEIEWADPLRPLGEVEIKKTIPVPPFSK